jgi:hypothetical protein
MRHKPFATTNHHTPAPSGQHDPVAPPRPNPNLSERKNANADPRRTLGTISANSGNVPDSSSPRRPSRATTRHAAEKRPPLLRTRENAAGTTPAETAKDNFVTTDPHTLYHTIDRKSLLFSFLYILTRFTISNQYYFTVLMLVIAWRKLDYGSIKSTPPKKKSKGIDYKGI